MDGVNLLVVKRGDLIRMYAQRIFIQYGLGWSCNSGFTPHDYVAIEWWGKTKHLEHSTLCLKKSMWSLAAVQWVNQR